MVVMTPFASIFRMRLWSVSERYALPSRSYGDALDISELRRDGRAAIAVGGTARHGIDAIGDRRRLARRAPKAAATENTYYSFPEGDITFPRRDSAPSAEKFSFRAEKLFIMVAAKLSSDSIR